MLISAHDVFSAIVCFQVMSRISNLRTSFKKATPRYLNPSADNPAMAYNLFYLDGNGNEPSLDEQRRRATILLENDSFLHSGHVGEDVFILFYCTAYVVTDTMHYRVI
jgi:hypothetical protein